MTEELVDAILRTAAKEKAASIRRVYVGAYAVTRNYGGPEEGGWYYNHYDHIESVLCDPADVEATIEALKAKHSDVAYGSIYSVLGGCELQVLREKVLADHATTERPHYS